MRLCIKPQSAYWRQPSTEEKPIKAVDSPETPPSVLTMGIPHFTPCIAAGPRYLEFAGAQLSIFCITTEFAKASLLLATCFGLTMMLPSLVAHSTDLPAPFGTGGFCLKGILATTGLQVRWSVWTE
jgi:hypothetical protein